MGISQIPDVDSSVVTTAPIDSPAGPVYTTFAAVNLRDLVKISAYTLDRQYTKGTLKNIEKEVITFTNTSNEFNIDVEIKELGGVKFTPSTFTLAKNSIQPVEITFDVTAVEQYPEGVSAVNCVVNFSSKDAVIVQPEPLPPPPPIVTIPSPIVVPVPESPSIGVSPTSTLWTEKRWLNRTNSILLSKAALASVNPTDIRRIENINFPSGIPERCFIIWDRVYNMRAGEQYRFSGRSDDGIRIYIDDQLIYNGWRQQPSTPFQALFTAPSTKSYTVRIEYFNNLDHGVCTVLVENISNVGPVVTNPTPTAPVNNTPVIVQPTPSEPVVSGGGGGGGSVQDTPGFSTLL